METLEIALSGRWRAAVVPAPLGGATAAAASLRDHIELRLGELSLTAHLGDDAVLPFLTTLAQSLATDDDPGRTHVPLSGHTLELRTDDGRLFLSFQTETGRHIVRDVPTDRRALRTVALEAGRNFLNELLSVRPEWHSDAVVRRLRTALGRLERTARGQTGETPVGPAPAQARRRKPAAQKSVFPLSFSEGSLRFGNQPALGPVSAAPLSRLVDAVEALARHTSPRVSVLWSTAPRTHLHLEQAPSGRIAWRLSDMATDWLTGDATLAALLKVLAQAASACPERERADLHLRLDRGRAWARASVSPPQLGANVLLPPPMQFPSPTSGPAPLSARRLFHVAFRRTWRRSLRRFFLPIQALDTPTIVVHTLDGTLGLARDSGKPSWRREKVHPMVPGGPPWLVVDRAGHVLALDLETGEPRWRMRQPWRRSPAVGAAHDGLGLVIATEAGPLLGLGNRGERQFEAKLLAGAPLGVTLSPALFWVTGEDRHLYAFRRGDGALHFRVPLGGNAVGAPLWTRSGVVVACERGTRSALLVFDAATGELCSDIPLEGQFQSVQIQADGPDRRETSLAVQTQMGESTTTYGIDATSARIRFRLENGPWRSSMTNYGGALFIGAHGGRVSAHDAQDGAALWELAGDDAAEDHVQNVRPLGVRGMVYVLGRTLRVIEPAEGRVVSRHPIDDLEVGSWLVSREGDVLLVDPERALVYLTLSGHLSHVD